MAGARYEWQRLKRVFWPFRYDRSAYLLIHAVGGWWLFAAGFKREYRIMTKQGWLILDFAHPKLKLCLEADGERYHRDIVHEEVRDSTLLKKGWAIKHFRYARLKHEPRKVRREVRRWFWNALILNYRR